jgi:hypothetical protein
MKDPSYLIAIVLIVICGVSVGVITGYGWGVSDRSRHCMNQHSVIQNAR